MDNDDESDLESSGFPLQCRKEENEPTFIAVVYMRLLKWVDSSDPLYNVPYIGQSVRAFDAYGTADKLAKARWTEENNQAGVQKKDVGLIAELRLRGPHAFEDSILEYRMGKRSVVQKWANEREVELIAYHGGPFKSPTAHCKQTLNLTHGGKWGSNFEGIAARSSVKFQNFLCEYKHYIDTKGSPYVTSEYVTESGYKLGQTVANVRSGTYIAGHPNEKEMRQKLDDVGFIWTPRVSDEFRDWKSSCSKRMWENESIRLSITNATAARKGTTEARAEQSSRSTAWWNGLSSTERESHIEKLCVAQSNPETIKRTSASLKEFYAALDDESKKNRADKISDAFKDMPLDKKNAWKTKLSIAHSTEHNKSTTSINVKRKWATQTTDERSSRIQKMVDSKAKIRDAELGDLSQEERRRFDLKVEREKAKSNRKTRKLEALRNAPGWRDAKQTDLSRAGEIFEWLPVVPSEPLGKLRCVPKKN